MKPSTALYRGQSSCLAPLIRNFCDPPPFLSISCVMSPNLDLHDLS